MTETAFPPPAAEVLVAPADLIDGPALVASISADLAQATDARTARATAVRHMAEAKLRANTTLRAAFTVRPHAARALVRTQAYLTDVLVTTALIVARDHLHPLPNPTEAERLAVLAKDSDLSKYIL